MKTIKTIGLVLLIALLFLLGHRAFAATADISQFLQPQQVQQAFDAWSVVLMGIGMVVWHLALKIWPPLLRAFPYIKANGGVFRIVGSFFWCLKPGEGSPPLAMPVPVVAPPRPGSDATPISTSRPLPSSLQPPPPLT